ncbi:hypothetical protein C8R43DRAFT_974732 [Mycena crocata]|nr:hypothetical protein C8R43DRAFT_974732 [Mycena crocata]
MLGPIISTPHTNVTHAVGHKRSVQAGSDEPIYFIASPSATPRATGINGILLGDGSARHRTYRRLCVAEQYSDPTTSCRHSTDPSANKSSARNATQASFVDVDPASERRSAAHPIRNGIDEDLPQLVDTRDLSTVNRVNSTVHVGPREDRKAFHLWRIVPILSRDGHSEPVFDSHDPSLCETSVRPSKRSGSFLDFAAFLTVETIPTRAVRQIECPMSIIVVKLAHLKGGQNHIPLTASHRMPPDFSCHSCHQGRIKSFALEHSRTFR